MFNIKGYMESKGMTQAEFAKILEVGQSAIARAENKKLAIPTRWITILNDHFSDIQGYISQSTPKFSVENNMVSYGFNLHDIIPPFHMSYKTPDDSMHIQGTICLAKEIDKSDILPGVEYIVRTKDYFICRKIYINNDELVLIANNQDEYSGFKKYPAININLSKIVSVYLTVLKLIY